MTETNATSANFIILAASRSYEFIFARVSAIVEGQKRHLEEEQRSPWRGDKCG
jgi:hypothetical protein